MLRTTIVCNHSFIPDLLTETNWVVDCGANRGEFATWMSRNTRSQVVSFEPDPRLFGALPKLDRVAFHNLAVAGRAGTLSLHLGGRMCSSLLYAETADSNTALVEAVELDAFLRRENVGEIGLLKLDIEGAELDVIAGVAPTFWQRVKQITCEFHEFLDPQSLPRVEQTLRYLEDQGFYWINFSRKNYGDVLLLNRRYVRVGLSEMTQLSSVKYWRGARRLAERRLASWRS